MHFEPRAILSRVSAASLAFTDFVWRDVHTSLQREFLEVKLLCQGAQTHSSDSSFFPPGNARENLLTRGMEAPPYHSL